MQYRLVVEYDGTDYHGWQLQADARTVQLVIEEALGRLLGHPARAKAAGRTDAGVHATGQVVSFQSSRIIPVEVVLRAMNALTPTDLSVRAAEIVPDDFDVRRSARRRSYRYRIWNRRHPSPFWRRYAWHVRQPLDVGAMATAARALEGEHDFSSFRAAGCDAEHAVRRVLHCGFEQRDELVVFEIEATAFLRHMVRNIIGTLVEIGQLRRSGDLAALLAARDRSLAAATAPAHGLCLIAVEY